MTVTKTLDCEYLVIIADLMVLLDSLDKFTVLIWLNGVEKPFKYDSTSDFNFMTEGIRIDSDNHHSILFYDNMVNIQVIEHKLAHEVL